MKLHFILYFECALLGFVSVALCGTFVPNFIMAADINDLLSASVSIITTIVLLYMIVRRIFINYKEIKASEKPKQPVNEYDYPRFS